MTHKVIAPKQTPARLPLNSTAICYLLLDRLSAPGWLWGVMGTLFVIVWAVSLFSLFTQKSVELSELK